MSKNRGRVASGARLLLVFGWMSVGMTYSPQSDAGGSALRAGGDVRGVPQPGRPQHSDETDPPPEDAPADWFEDAAPSSLTPARTRGGSPVREAARVRGVTRQATPLPAAPIAATWLNQGPGPARDGR